MLEPKPYQIATRDFILSHPRCGIFLKMGLGKALDDRTIIPLYNGGTKKLKDISLGDALFDKNGNKCQVTDIYRHPATQGWRVILADGKTFVCCKDHLLDLEDETGNHHVKALKDIMDEPEKWYIPLTKPVKHRNTTHTVEWLKHLARRQQNFEDGDTDNEPPATIIMPDIPFHQANEILKDIDSMGLYRNLIKNKNEKTSDIIIWPSRHRVQISEIRKSRVMDMRCLTVTGDTHTFLIKDYIVTHNTLSTLLALDQLKKDGNLTGHTLVIAPKAIARSTWIDEIEKWDFDFPVKSFIFDEKGKAISKKKRHQMYKDAVYEAPTIYLINRELLCDLVANLPVIEGARIWSYPFVVVDEFQSFKSSKSQRFKALRSVSDCINRLIGLTGTPAPNGVEDLWSQIYLLDGGKRLGKTMTSFRERWFYPGLIKNNHPVTWVPRRGASAEIHELIKDITMSAQSVKLDLPDVTFDTVTLHLDDAEKKVYDDFKNELVMEIDGMEITAANAAVLCAKLSQMASGSIYTDDQGHYAKIHEHKLDYTSYIIENADSPVLVAYYYKSDLDMLTKRLTAKKVDFKVFDGSREMLKDWNDKKIPVLLVQPASAGHGLNFQFGGHTLIWYTLPWNLEYYQQCNARLYRTGQKEPVVIHQLVMEDTIDEKVIAALAKKDMSQKALLDAVNIMLKSITPDP